MLARASAATLACFAFAAHAQIAADGTGVGTAVGRTGNDWSITAGTQVGGNLFHSFSAFGIPTSHSATFSGASSVQNIISRVTGASATTIDGLLRSTIPGANFWLINPNGVTIGANATLDVQGSFHVSTADYLSLGAEGRFDARDPAASVLASAPPSAFGFVGPQVSPVTVVGATLSVPERSDISFVGGEVTVSGAMLSAPAGSIRIGSVASAGEIAPAAGGGFQLSGSPALGAVQIEASQLSVDSVAGAPAGRIAIRGGSLILLDSGLSSTNFEPGTAGGVDIDLSGGFGMSGGTIFSDTFGPGHSGGVAIRASSIAVSDGALITSDSLGAGGAGDITFASSGSVSITGGSGVQALALADGAGASIRVDAASISIDDGYIAAESHAVGDTGDVVIHAASLDMANFAFVGARSFDAGSSGAVTLSIDGAARLVDSEISTDNSGQGMGGALVLEAGSLELVDSALAAISRGPARGGDISVSVGGDMVMQGLFNVIVTGAEAGGDAGHVSVSAGTLRITDSGIVASSDGAGRGGDIALSIAGALELESAHVSSSAFGIGGGGNISIAAGSLSLTDLTTITTQNAGPSQGGSIAIVTAGAFSAVDSDLLATASGTGSAGSIGIVATDVTLRATNIIATSFGDGSGGSLSLTAGTLVMEEGADIESQTLGAGRGGDIRISLTGAMRMHDAGITANATFGSTGDGGNIFIDAQSLVAENFRISSDTSGAGNGGRIAINTSGPVELSNGAGFISGISANTSQSGQAGSIAMSAESVWLSGYTFISSDTSGSGTSGSITIAVQDRFRFSGEDRSGISQPGFGQVSTGAILGTGDAGTIDIEARTVELEAADISSLAGNGASNAGRISITASESIALSDQSSVRTDSFSEGMAGDISLSAPLISLRGNSTVLSETRGSGPGGVIRLLGRDVHLEGASFASAATTGSGRGGAIIVQAEGTLSMSEVGGLFSGTTGAGQAGDVDIQAGTVRLTSGAQIAANTLGSGASGAVRINADTVVVHGETADSSNVSIITSQSNLGATGNAGSVLVQARRIEMLDGGHVDSSTFDSGNGGTVTLIADSVLLSGAGQNFTATLSAATLGAGQGGSIEVTAREFTLLNAGQVQVTARSTGNAGSISMRIAERLAADGVVGTNAAGVYGTTQGDGAAGNIDISAGTISLTNGGVVSTSSNATGRGGSIAINAANVDIAGVSAGDGEASGVYARASGDGTGGSIRIGASNVTVRDRGLVTAQAQNAGDAGDIDIEAGTLRLLGGTISAEAFASGSAGSVTIRAPVIALSGSAEITAGTLAGGKGGSLALDGGGSGVITLEDDATISASSVGSGAGGSIQMSSFASVRLGGFSHISSQALASGAGGAIEIRAGEVLLDGVNFIGAGTGGSGAGGDVLIEAAGSVRVAPHSFIDASGAEFSSGSGGSVTVRAADVLVRGGSISALNEGEGNAGSIRVEAARSLSLLDGGSIATRTRSGDGGDIVLVVGDLVLLRHGTISTSVGSGQGNGGNIFIDPVFVVLDHGRIVANAFGGDGGNIGIVSQFLLSSPGSVIDASSALGISGGVTIAAPEVDLGAGLAALPSGFFDASGLIRQSCASRAQSGASTLVGAGRGGLAADPLAPLPAAGTLRLASTARAC